MRSRARLSRGQPTSFKSLQYSGLADHSSKGDQKARGALSWAVTVACLHLQGPPLQGGVCGPQDSFLRTGLGRPAHRSWPMSPENGTRPLQGCQAHFPVTGHLLQVGPVSPAPREFGVHHGFSFSPSQMSDLKQDAISGWPTVCHAPSLSPNPATSLPGRHYSAPFRMCDFA